MAYTAEISRANPSCFIFLIDQSGSMQEVMDPTNIQPIERPMVVDGQQFTHTASGPTKAQTVADVINKLLTNLVLRCTRNDGVRSFYDVGVLGYGGDDTASRVAPAFTGSLSGRELVSITDIANLPARIEQRNKKVSDGAGGLVEQGVKMPIWFDAVAKGGTPMCAALAKAQAVLSGWTAQHPSSFPPIVINISDGDSTDGDPVSAADGIKGLATNDGGVVVFNIHISSKKGAPIEFPDSDAALPDDLARKLYSMSSLLPPHLQAAARQEGMNVTEMTRGFAFNADLVALIRFLDIGTRASNLR